MAAERPLLFADSSALVKLVVEERESAALEAFLENTTPVLAASLIALVEVPRAVGIATPRPEARADAVRLVRSCVLVDVTRDVVRSAADLAGLYVRTLDAIQLASALRIDADAMLVYDSRLSAAATAAGLPVQRPGART